MKKGRLQFVLALLILPLLSFAYGPSEIEGFYADRNGNHQYEVEANSHGLLLKAVRHGDWVRFDRQSRNQFVGPRGQKLVVLDRGTLKLKKKHQTVTLKKTRRGDHKGWSKRYDNDKRGRDYGWTQRNSHYNGNDGHWNRQLGGTWYNHNGNRMLVDQYRNGLSVNKGKHHKRSEFYYQVKTWDRVAIYKNDFGDTITAERNGDLTWRGHRGHKVQHYHKECR